MIYRKEIDGLRALAVVPVILFHAGFSLFEGGYVGVDIFFVISGYLITSIIISDISNSRFSLSYFYERRARRILPPLYLVMMASTIFVFFNYPPFNAKDFYQSLIATTLFLSNHFFYLETDYFNDFSESAPLLHTWSLAAEEQFYLVFPLLLIVLSKFKFSIKIISVVLLFTLSLIYSFFESSSNPTANFYLLPSRFWELLIGALIALVLSQNHKAPKYLQTKLVSNIFSVFGLGLILFSVFTFDDKTIFPGIHALFPTIGTGLLIIFLTSKSVLYKVFSYPPLVYIGLLSYSLYLWHQPIFAASRSYSLVPLSNSIYFVLIGFSFFLSLLSYKYVESPFRNKKMIPRKTLVPVLLSCAIFFISFGYLGHSKDGFRDLVYERHSSVSNIILIDKEFELNKRSKIWKGILENSLNSFDNSKSKILIIGDSKSEDLFVSMKLNQYFDNKYQIIRLKLNDACMNIQLIFQQRNVECSEDLNNLNTFLKTNRPDFIIFSNTWTGKYNNNVVKFISQISNSFKVIVFSTANFNDMTDISLLISRKNIKNPRSFIFHNIKQDDFKESNELKNLLNTSSVIFIEKLELFCDFKIQECNILDTKPLIYDSGHLTDHGAVYFGNKLQEINFLNL